MRLLRTLTTAAVLTAAALHAEPVYFSAHGKTFHRSEQCMSLARSTHVYTADRATAEAHGLKPCSICYRPKKAGSKTASAAPSWAKEAQR